jgi:hypothetical protein
MDIKTFKNNIDKVFLNIFLKMFLFWLFFPSILIVAIANFNFKTVKLDIEKYQYNFYSDRNYGSENKMDKFIGLSVVLIPRHIPYDIFIDSLNGNTTVYRLISESNDNTSFNLWSKSTSPILVKGHTGNLTEIIWEKYSTNKIELIAGGPIHSSPILISNEISNNIHAYYRINLIKKYYPNGFFNYMYTNISIDRLFKLKFGAVLSSLLFLLLALSLKKRLELNFNE